MASRNHPDHPPDDELLESARRILTTGDNTFAAIPWRTTMARAQSEANQKAMKAAQQKLGIKPPKEEAKPAASPVLKETGTRFAAPETGQDAAGTAQLSESDMQAIHAGRRATDPIIGHIPVLGGSQGQKDVVESGFSIFNQSQKGHPMTEDTKAPNSNFPEKRASPEQAAKEAAAKQAIADKAAKKEAAAAKAAETKAAREAAALARAAKIAENATARAAKAEELKAAGRTYVGSMTQLAERVKAGAYVKSLTGQLRSNDDLAVALDAVPAVNVVILGMKALKLTENPYAALNIGQQSMNLRNRMRGAIKKGTLTLDEVKNIRDQDGLATAEAEAAKKKEAAAERAKKQEEAKAAKLAAEQKAKEAKAAAAPAPEAAEKPKAVKKDKPAQAAAA